MDLDVSVLRPVVARALDAMGLELVEWSAVPILAGDGQGLGVFRVTGSARIGHEPRKAEAARGREASVRAQPRRGRLR